MGVWIFGVVGSWVVGWSSGGVLVVWSGGVGIVDPKFFIVLMEIQGFHILDSIVCSMVRLIANAR